MPGVTSTTQRLESVVREDGQVLGATQVKQYRMTLTVCGEVDPGFAASACWQPAEKTELTANKMATMIRKLIPTPQ